MELISTHTILTSDLGIKGNLFGGKFMAWIDVAAAALAVQTIKNPNILTLKISECVFHKPAKINNLIKIYGEVLKIGRTSITVLVEARRLVVSTGEESIICTTSVVMVQVDDHGVPSEILISSKQK